MKWHCTLKLQVLYSTKYTVWTINRLVNLCHQGILRRKIFWLENMVSLSHLYRIIWWIESHHCFSAFDLIWLFHTSHCLSCDLLLRPFIFPSRLRVGVLYFGSEIYFLFLILWFDIQRTNNFVTFRKVAWESNIFQHPMKNKTANFHCINDKRAINFLHLKWWYTHSSIY